MSRQTANPNRQPSSSDGNVWLPVRTFGTPVEYLDHGSCEQVLQRCGLTVEDIAEQTELTLAGLDMQALQQPTVTVR